MQRQAASLLMLMAACCGAVSELVRAEEYPKLSPYPAIRWTPEVEIDGKWYALRSINDFPVATIIEFAQKQYDSLWSKRFNEDLVQVLTELGRPPGETVKLVLRDLETGEETTIDKAPLSAAFRDAIRNPQPPLTADALTRALDEFAAALDQRWSYRHGNSADFAAAIGEVREKIDAGISVNDFGIELQKVLALGIDGHAEVSGYTLPRGGCLPLLIEPEGERLVAFKPDRTGFLAEGYPYLTKIDGKEIAEWRQAAAVLVPKGSPQYVLRHCLRLMRELDYLRTLMKLPKKQVVEIELVAGDGKRRSLTLPVATQSPVYGVWPRSRSRLLEGNIGYLRLSSMDEDAVEAIKTWLPRFRDTEGIVVDVRDNGGGLRDPMRLLYAHLAAPDDPPRVFTTAAYRVHASHQSDHLAERFMYRADAAEWSDAERQAITKFASTFEPAWDLPRNQFSDWHYMVLSRLDDKTIIPYSKPVVVLMNAKCFSATDVFLAGLKGMKNVTLLGTPSGGGSAFVQEIELRGTPFRVRLGSMASFQGHGELFDGHGVAPNIILEATPEYHIGGQDNVLVAAVKRIKRQP